MDRCGFEGRVREGWFCFISKRFDDGVKGRFGVNLFRLMLGWCVYGRVVVHVYCE